MGAALKQTQKTTGKEIHTDTNFYFRPETFRVGLRILFQPLKFRGRVIQGPKPPTLLFQGIACGKPNQVKLFAKVFGVDGERKSIRGKLLGQNWDKCRPIRLSRKRVLPHGIEGSWARPLSPFRTPDMMQG
jgi:hypothetical protein